LEESSTTVTHYALHRTAEVAERIPFVTSGLRKLRIGREPSSRRVGLGFTMTHFK
jgi:hypothetical protein